jgi:hypothetical protein
MRFPHVTEVGLLRVDGVGDDLRRISINDIMKKKEQTGGFSFLSNPQFNLPNHLCAFTSLAPL